VWWGGAVHTVAADRSLNECVCKEGGMYIPTGTPLRCCCNQPLPLCNCRHCCYCCCYRHCCYCSATVAAAAATVTATVTAAATVATAVTATVTATVTAATTLLLLLEHMELLYIYNTRATRRCGAGTYAVSFIGVASV